jgi:hypothetical protein
MAIIEATAINRSFIYGPVGDFTVDFLSHIAAFKDSKIVSIQACFSGLTHNDGVLELLVSNLPDDDTFLPSGHEPIVVDAVRRAAGGHIWSFADYSFRYGRIRWTKGSNTAGTGKIIAVGKR